MSERGHKAIDKGVRWPSDAVELYERGRRQNLRDPNGAPSLDRRYSVIHYFGGLGFAISGCGALLVCALTAVASLGSASVAGVSLGAHPALGCGESSEVTRQGYESRGGVAPQLLPFSQGELSFDLGEIVGESPGQGADLSVRVVRTDGSVVVPWTPVTSSQFQHSLEPGAYGIALSPTKTLRDEAVSAWAQTFVVRPGAVSRVRLMQLKPSAEEPRQLKVRLRWQSDAEIDLTHAVVWGADRRRWDVLTAEERHLVLPGSFGRVEVGGESVTEWTSSVHQFPEHFYVRFEPQGWTMEMHVSDLDSIHEVNLGALERIDLEAATVGRLVLDPASHLGR